MRGKDYLIYLNGRIVFDAYKEVRLDTAITGRVPNKQLKTVAEYFQDPTRGVIPEDVPIIRLSYAEQRNASPDQLAEYCLSDSRLTALLTEYYLRTLKDLAVYIEAPLNLITDRSPSHVGNYIFGKYFKRLGIVSDGANYDRFRGILWE
jgi:DNA polymerase elongation subunit (family B)